MSRRTIKLSPVPWPQCSSRGSSQLQTRIQGYGSLPQVDFGPRGTHAHVAIWQGEALVFLNPITDPLCHRCSAGLSGVGAWTHSWNSIEGMLFKRMTRSEIHYEDLTCTELRPKISQWTQQHSMYLKGIAISIAITAEDNTEREHAGVYAFTLVLLTVFTLVLLLL